MTSSRSDLQRGGPHVLGESLAPAPGQPASAARFCLILESLETRTAPTVNVFNDVADEVTLRQDIAAADSNQFADNVIELANSVALSETSDSQIVIENATSLAKTLTIEPQGPASVKIQGSVGWNTRIFEIVGTGSASVTVVFKDLEITGGKAHDGGVLGGTAALGGGILIDGGQVTLSHASVIGNAVSGGMAAGPGGGGSAQGGGIYLATGQLTVRNSQVLHNTAAGGNGNDGGNGAPGAAGGIGGGGGSGAGGGIYQGGGGLNLTGATVSGEAWFREVPAVPAAMVPREASEQRARPVGAQVVAVGRRLVAAFTWRPDS